MSKKESSVRLRRPRVSAALTVVVALVVLAALTPAVQGRSVTPAARLSAKVLPDSYRVVSRSYHGVYAVNGLVSIKTTALLDLINSNNSEELVLFNASANSSKVVQSEVPGGTHVNATGLIATGGYYLLALQNLTSGREFWEKVTTTGKISTFQGKTLPVNGNFTWSFPYGNGSAFFAASGDFLLQLNPSTMQIVTNYTYRLPSGFDVTSVLPLGQRLYFAGYYFQANRATVPWFGYLVAGANSTHYWTITNASVGVGSGFDSLIAYGGNVYVGGYMAFYNSPTNYRTVIGYLYEFVPGAPAFLNLSSLLPLSNAGVFALEPWGSTIALSLTYYMVNASRLLGMSGGIYTLASTGLTLVSEAAVFPAGFLAYIYAVTAASGGWYFSGGFNSRASCAEVVAVKA